MRAAKSMAHVAPDELIAWLSACTETLGTLLEFETSLRENLIARLSDNPAWWKQYVPKQARTDAQLRRLRDKDSPFAPRLGYHPIYYCYFDDLKQIVQQSRAVFFSTPPRERDVENRLEELVALRNRLAHGRLLTGDECARVGQLVSELRALLELTALSTLTCEDPQALRVAAREYCTGAIAALRAADLPQKPAPLVALLHAASTQDELTDDERSQLTAMLEFLQSTHAMDRTPGFKMRARRALEEKLASGFVDASLRALDRLAESDI